MHLESYDQHIEDSFPEWPVSFGEFEKVAVQLMHDECKKIYPPEQYLFPLWLYLHFDPYRRCGYAPDVWGKMKRDLTETRKKSPTFRWGMNCGTEDYCKGLL